MEKSGVASRKACGMAFSSLSRAAQFQTGFLGFVSKIRERHYPVVDEETQAVFAVTTF
jgi:hypothetical protein